jgi:hypothetical protein
VSRGRDGESDGEEDDGGGGGALQLQAVYRQRDVASYLQDVRARSQASRSAGRLAMTFPGGLEIEVQVGRWAGGGLDRSRRLFCGLDKESGFALAQFTNTL